MNPCRNALYVSLIKRCDSAAMVPNTKDDLPDPETPVNTVSRRFGSSRRIRMAEVVERRFSQSFPRYYDLYVPDGSGPFPLVVALHGLGSNPNQIMRYPGLTDQAEKYGYVVVAPMGYNSVG